MATDCTCVETYRQRSSPLGEPILLASSRLASEDRMAHLAFWCAPRIVYPVPRCGSHIAGCLLWLTARLTACWLGLSPSSRVRATGGLGNRTRTAPDCASRAGPVKPSPCSTGVRGLSRPVLPIRSRLADRERFAGGSAGSPRSRRRKPAPAARCGRQRQPLPSAGRPPSAELTRRLEPLPHARECDPKPGRSNLSAT